MLSSTAAIPRRGLEKLFNLGVLTWVGRLLQLHAACCSGLPSQAWMEQGPSGRNSLNYPPAQLASVIAMGPLFTKTSLTQRQCHHHGDGEGVGDHVLYVVTVVIKPLAFMRCMAVACACTQYACRNSDRSARPPVAETWESRSDFLESCRTHTFVF